MIPDHWLTFSCCTSCFSLCLVSKWGWWWISALLSSCAFKALFSTFSCIFSSFIMSFWVFNCLISFFSVSLLVYSCALLTLSRVFSSFSVSTSVFETSISLLSCSLFVVISTRAVVSELVTYSVYNGHLTQPQATHCNCLAVKQNR